MNKLELASYIDHTLLKADAVREEIEQLCHEAVNNSFAAVCVNPYWVPLCAEILENTDVKVCAVVGFPLGATMTKIKCAEAQLCLENRATEIDMVVNIGAVKDGHWDFVREEIEAVTALCHDQNAEIKVIFETCILNNAEISTLAEICAEVGVDYLKTSTGFSNDGGRIEAVALMRAVVGERCKIKASGGIRDYNSAVAFINNSVDRIGTSSSMKILESAD